MKNVIILGQVSLLTRGISGNGAERTPKGEIRQWPEKS